MTSLILSGADGTAAAFTPMRGIIAGWAGRDRQAIQHHIEELGVLGVKAPSTVPLYYRVGAALFTTAPVIEAVGSDSSGEVEPVLFHDGNGLRLGLGSDHTDRALETHSVAMSKQVCAKPMAAGFWNFDEVEPHADRIEFQSWIRSDAGEDWTLYQQGSLANLRPLRELIAGARAAHGENAISKGTIMMCGTFGVTAGGIRPAGHFRMSMHDPVLNRTIEHAYETVNLPVIA